MSHLRARTLGAYRNLLRARDVTFKGDVQMQKRVTNEIKNGFFSNRKVTNEVELEGLIKQAEEAAQFIKYGLVQAVKEQNDAEFKVRLTEEQVIANLDAEVKLKPVDEKMIENAEKLAKRKQK